MPNGGEILAYGQQVAEQRKEIERLKRRIRWLENRLDEEKVKVKGANERAMQLLKAKDYWLKKYLEGE